MRKQTAVIFILVLVLTACGTKKADDMQESASAEPAEEVVIAQGSREDNEQGRKQEEELEVPALSSNGEETALDGLPIISESYTIEDCIKLPELDSLKVPYEEVPAPTYDDALIYARLQKDARPTNNDYAEARGGDVVSVDLYAEEERYTRLALSIAVGAKIERPEIEEALIGMEPGEKKEITVTYPDDYTYMDLNGKTISYIMIVNSIARPAEPIDVEVGKAMEFLKKEADFKNRMGYFEAAKKVLLENSVFTAYPEEVIRKARKRYEDKYLSGYDSLNDYLDRIGMTKAEFKKEENEYAVQRAREQLVLMALQDKTGITTSSDEYRNYSAVYGINREDPDRTLFEAIVFSIRDASPEGGEKP